MEVENQLHDGGGLSRPSIGFPLGTALLLVVIFTLSGIFSCCYHWNKLRRILSRRDADIEADGEIDADVAKACPTDFKEQGKFTFPLIIMPGDEVPKFIAMPCPSEPPRPGKIVAEVWEPTAKPLPSPRHSVE